MKKQFLLIMMALLPMLASAGAVNIGDIWYNLIPKGNFAEVTQSPTGYSGNIVIPDKINDGGIVYTVNYIGDNAFMNCSGLTSVTIPSSVTTIGDNAFLMCTGLTAIIIPEKVNTIGNYAFKDCSNITSIIIPQSVTSIGEGAFAHSGLTSISIPSSISAISSSAFFECLSLTSAIIPSSVTDIFNNSFEGCSNLTSVTISEGVNSISTSAFARCSSLESIIIPSTVTSFGMSAFENCSSLISANIPSGVTFLPDNLFKGCSKLGSINIPNDVTSISSRAFAGCTALTSIVIPAKVTYIGTEAFSNCSNLTDVYSQSENVDNDPALMTGIYATPDAFSDSYQEYITLHVPASSISAYKAIEPWKYFKGPVALSDGPSTLTKCDTPVITYADGKIDFTCTTDGVEFVSSVTSADANSYSGSSITLKLKFTVSVYATKDGFDNSDVATKDIEIIIGDIDGNGTLNAIDMVKLANIILKQNQ